MTLFEELRGHIDAALEWISKYGDLNGDGYVEYASTSGKGLINQGWKDSSDAIIDTELRRSPGGAPVAGGPCPR